MLSRLTSDTFLSSVRGVCYQVETCPTTKSNHVQGYVELANARTFDQIKRLLGNNDRVHVEHRKGSKMDCIRYCSKVETRAEGFQPVFSGSCGAPDRDRTTPNLVFEKVMENVLSPRDVALSDVTFFARYHKQLRAINELATKEATKAFRTVKVHVIFGEAGTGKSRRCWELDPELYCLDHDDKSLWFDGYAGEKTLLLDDFYGWIKYSYLLRLLDGYQCRLPIKGGFVYAQWTQVFITSNVAPDQWYRDLGLTPALKRRLTTIKTIQEALIYGYDE